MKALRCTKCQDLVFDERDISFEVNIQHTNQASASCSICFLLSQASSIYQKTRRSPVQNIQVLNSASEVGPLLDLSYVILRLFHTSRSPNAKRPIACPVRRVIPSDPSVGYYSGTVSRWLTTCLSGHQNCRESQSSREPRLMPARLLHLGTSGDRTIKVVDVTDPSVLFVALSYCWGDGSRLTLTEGNLHSFHSSIPRDMIPRTIRDAMDLTVQLQIPYIWIDALCIVQDSQQDWQRESVKMKDIYKHAHLVINTDRAADTDTGFMNSRRQAGHVIQIPRSHPEADRFAEVLVVPARFYVEQDTDPYDGAHRWFLSSGEGFGNENEFVNQNPVFGRAWCLQEQILAARTIHFTDTEMIWECLEDSYCECEGIDENNRRGCLTNRDLWGKVPEPELWKRTWFNLRHIRERSVLLKEWWGCVEQYSSRKLTVKSDILPSISGLAKDFPENVLGRYHAGQWSNDFPFGLLWHSNEETHPHCRPPCYTAPSWSWASVVGVIRRPPPMHDPIALAKVTQPTTNPIGTDTYGQVTNSSLNLTAPMMDINVSYHLTPDGKIKWSLSLPGEWQDSIFGTTFPAFRKIREAFDIDPPFPHDTKTLDSFLSSLDLTCAFIAKDILEDSVTGFHYALLLNRVRGEGDYSFERVGMAIFDTYMDNSKLNLEEVTVNII